MPARPSRARWWAHEAVRQREHQIVQYIEDPLRAGRARRRVRVHAGRSREGRIPHARLRAHQPARQGAGAGGRRLRAPRIGRDPLVSGREGSRRQAAAPLRRQRRHHPGARADPPLLRTCVDLVLPRVQRLVERDQQWGSRQTQSRGRGHRAREGEARARRAREDARRRRAFGGWFFARRRHERVDPVCAQAPPAARSAHGPRTRPCLVPARDGATRVGIGGRPSRIGGRRVAE